MAAGERSGATGVVIWKAPNARDDDAVVVLRLKDWQDLGTAAILKILNKEKRPAGSKPDGPFDYVHGVTGEPGNGGTKHLEHTARLETSATGDLVNSP